MPLPPERHLLGALQVPLAVGAETGAHRVERLLVAEAREDVVHDAVGGARVVDVVGDDPRDVERARQGDELPDELALLGQPVVPALHGDAPVEDVEQRRERLARPIAILRGEPARHPPARTPREREQPLGVAREELERHARISARMIHARAGEEGGEIAVPGPGLGEEGEVNEAGLGTRHSALGGEGPSAEFRWPSPDVHGQLGPDDPPEVRVVRRLREDDGAAEVVVVGERERGVAELDRALDEHLGVRGAIEEGEGGVAVELDVRHGVSRRGDAVQSSHP